MSRSVLSQARSVASIARAAASVARSGVVLVQNHVIQSEDCNAANWTRQNATVQTNQVANAYDGALTMDKITDDAVNSNHRCYVTSITLKAGKTYTFSIDWKDHDIGFASLLLDMGVGNNIIIINLSTGAITYSQSATTLYNLPIVASVKNMGNGIWKIIMTLTMKATSSPPFISCGVCSNGTTFSYSGTGKAAHCGRVKVVEANWEGPDCPTTTVAINPNGRIRDIVL